MNEQAELLKKIKTFLDSKKISYNDGSLEFIGVRKNYKLQESDPQDYYFVSYDVLTDREDKYSTKTYFVYINQQTLKISYILGPQTIQRIEE